MQIMGIDIGGSGIKGAPVETETGVLLAERLRLPTPEPSKPAAVAKIVGEITRSFNWQGPIGVGFPSVVRGGITYSAANVHRKWIGADAAGLFAQATGCPVLVLNDADAAGIAEMTFGAGRGRMGVVLLITIGTGLGSALFTDGHLVPNTEFGHLQIRGLDAEWRASDAARKREKLSWKQWSARLNEFLQTLEGLFSPDLFILGGGVIKMQDKFVPRLKLRADILPAQLMNDAGIVGAALAAQKLAAA
jgi:polyphosphate glucokinase